jgi:hypothetical protein
MYVNYFYTKLEQLLIYLNLKHCNIGLYSIFTVSETEILYFVSTVLYSTLLLTDSKTAICICLKTVANFCNSHYTVLFGVQSTVIIKPYVHLWILTSAFLLLLSAQLISICMMIRETNIHNSLQ